jgi:hypothetical protein
MANSNPKTVKDNLKRDPPIAGQRYTIFSFVNPKDNVLERNIYNINQFLVEDLNKTISAQAMAMVKKLSSEMRHKVDNELNILRSSVDEEDKHLYRILSKHFTNMLINEDEFIEDCNRLYSVDQKEIMDRYKVYLVQNRTRLDRDFADIHQNRCSVRGVKCRGTCDDISEAREQAKKLRNIEPGVHVYIIETGTWIPLDMDADEVQDQDYMLPALNELMSGYEEGMRNKDMFFDDRRKEMMNNTDNTTSRKELARQKLRDRLAKKRANEAKKDIAAVKAAGSL